MPSSTSSSNRSPVRVALPWALLAALIAFSACERLLWTWRAWIEFCGRYAGPAVSSDPLRTTVRIALLPRHEPQVPILLMGSSQIHEGLDCTVFDARFPGRTCRNLAIAGGTPLDLLFMMRQVDERVRRRIVITGAFAGTLHNGPKAAFSDTTTLSCIFRSGQWRDLDATEWIELLYGQIQDLAPTLRAKDSLRALWHFVERNPRAALRAQLPPPHPRVLDGRPPRAKAFLRGSLGVVDSTRGPRFSAAQEVALDELIAGETERGNRIVIIDFPARRGYDTTIPPEALEAHRRLIEHIAARSDVYLVGSGDLPPLSDDDFHDFTHLRASGRRKMSERIADILLKIGG